MNNMVSNFVIFAAGAGLGALAMHLYTRDKVDREIADARELYIQRAKKLKDDAEAEKEQTPVSDVAEDPETVAQYVNYADRYKPDADRVDIGYSELYSKPSVDKVVKEVLSDTKPDSYLISADDFAYDDENSKMTLTRYSDGVIADSFTDHVIIQNDVLNQIGIDLIAELDGDQEEIFIRNPVLGIDFDILKEEHTYAEVTGR